MIPPRYFITMFLTAGLALAAAPSDDVKALTGTWKPASAELGGQPMPPVVLKTITLKITGASYEVAVETEKGTAFDRGTLTLDTAATPKGMEVIGVEGPNAGKKFPCIYELKGDTLRICYDLSGAKRPSEFKTVAGTKLYVVTYQRAK